MAEKYLVVVDMQNDFVTGCLGTQEARQIVNAVVEKVASFSGKVVFTMDTHTQDYMNTQEGAFLPVMHCVRGEQGWELIPQLAKLCAEKNCKIFEKPAFGSLALAGYISDLYTAGEVESVELIGVCTDICVVSNALLLKANAPELPVFVDAACCAGVTPEKHTAALETMRSCQIKIINGD